jgi:hypothetical protein
MDSNGTKCFVLNGKGRVNHIFDAIDKHPVEGRVEVGIDGLDVLQCDRFVEKHLVERRRESAVNVVSMEDCCANNSTNKMKIGQVIRIDTTVGVDLQCVNVVTEIKSIYSTEVAFAIVLWLP